jgi:glutaminyl-peptide cyclotransferase
MESGAGSSRERQAPGPEEAQLPVLPTRFDGQRAFAFLELQCQLGPRPTGSPQSEQLQQLLREHFEREQLEVRFQRFMVAHPVERRAVAARNVVARYRPEAKRRILLGAHYDTRPFADEEPRRPHPPYLGANDGASGVAVLIELSRHLRHLELDYGVDLVCFDAEEFVYGPYRPPQQDQYCLGSKHFAQRLRIDSELRTYMAAVIVDMVGDKELTIYPERYSVENARWLVEDLWTVARSLRVRSFRWPEGGQLWKYEIYDDHVPLLEVGIPSIDLIDFDYPHWHRATDTVEQCSAQSLQDVGTVLLHWLASRAMQRR